MVSIRSGALMNKTCHTYGTSDSRTIGTALSICFYIVFSSSLFLRYNDWSAVAPLD